MTYGYALTCIVRAASQRSYTHVTVNSIQFNPFIRKNWWFLKLNTQKNYCLEAEGGFEPPLCVHSNEFVAIPRNS